MNQNQQTDVASYYSRWVGGWAVLAVHKYEKSVGNRERSRARSDLCRGPFYKLVPSFDAAGAVTRRVREQGRCIIDREGEIHDSSLQFCCCYNPTSMDCLVIMLEPWIDPIDRSGFHAVRQIHLLLHKPFHHSVGGFVFNIPLCRSSSSRFRPGTKFAKAATMSLIPPQRQQRIGNRRYPLLS